MAEQIKLQISDNIAIATMVNGENRFRMSFVKEWNEILDKVESNKSVKALIIRGHGKFFSYGLDLEFLATQTSEHVEHFRAFSAKLYQRISIFPVPTVALINGHAFGAGAFLALSCDYRVMRADRGWLCWPETARGMKFRPSSIELIRAKIPPGRSQRDAIVFSQRLTAEKAKVLQLVDAVASEDKLYECALELIRGARGLDRDSLSKMKRDIYGQEVAFSKM